MESTVITSQEAISLLSKKHDLTKIGNFLQINKKPQLQNPEESVGEFCGKKKGRRCWKAKGPALETYNRLSPSILNHLNSFKDEVEGSDSVTFMIYMIGKSPAKARPMIMFACPNKASRETAMKRIRDSNIVQVWMEVGHWDFPPDIPYSEQLGEYDEHSYTERGSSVPEFSRPGTVQVALWDTLNTASLAQRMTSGPHHRRPRLSQPRAVQVAVSDFSNNPSGTQRATIGAIIRTRNQSFYLSANHPFTNTEGLKSPSTTSVDDGNDDECDFGDYESDSDSDSEIDEQCTNPTMDQPQVLSHTPLQSMTEALIQAISEPIRELQCSMDALTMTLRSGLRNRSVTLSPQYRYRYSMDLDYALILTNQKTNIQLYFNETPVICSTEGIPVISPEMASDVPLQDVPVLTITKSGGVLEGTLSGTPSYSKLPGSQRFQKVFTVKFNGQLNPGDCGACVLDSDGRKLFGHIVAGSTISNVAYIVPALDVLRDANLLSSDPVSGDGAIVEDSHRNTFSDVPETLNGKEQSSEIVTDREVMVPQISCATLSLDPQSITGRFPKVLAAKRMNYLTRRSRCGFLSSGKSTGKDRASSMPGPAVDIARGRSWNLPLVPKQPADNRSMLFRDRLHMLSNIPLAWENPGLLDEALLSVPLERIYAEADEETQLYKILAQSLSQSQMPDWGYQDCVIKSLLSWFKSSFFTWVNNPNCTKCPNPTVGVGTAEPLDDEKARGVNSVELYQCTEPNCRTFVRFPRYNDAFVLMQTRRGRVGEWAICFGMLCRAMGSRVRWVWNSENHVWIEYFSIHHKRWVHVDPTEGWLDRPRNYTEGWRRQLSYCIAFSRDGAMDVTRRYVPGLQWMGNRTRATEEQLLYILDEIRKARRKDFDRKEHLQLQAEDVREQMELSKGVATQLAVKLCKSLPGCISSSVETTRGNQPLDMENQTRKDDFLGTTLLFEGPAEVFAPVGHDIFAKDTRKNMGA